MAKDQQNKGLDKVTDYAEDKKIDAGDANLAKSKAQEAMAALEKAEQEAKKAEGERQKKLSAVKINPNDVTLIHQEMEISKSQAETKLREAGGDAFKAMLLLAQGS